MFLDSLCGDAAWLGRYARDRKGAPIPWELLERSIREKHPYEVLMLRGMIAVPYFEKALYELPEVRMSRREEEEPGGWGEEANHTPRLCDVQSIPLDPVGQWLERDRGICCVL